MLEGHILERLEWLNLDNITGGLGPEDSRFASEGVDSLAGAGCGFTYNLDFQKAGHGKYAGSVTFDVTVDNLEEFIKNSRNIFFLQFGAFSNRGEEHGFSERFLDWFDYGLPDGHSFFLCGFFLGFFLDCH